jgi:hypothetical protein
MTRKVIPDDTQKNVLTNSRRRCCLCFWLEGKDEAQKGQIAHLDRNNENAAEDNLVFLCLVHHDEYDSKTSVTKGLRDDEVRHWRDELYKEMSYRFRTVKRFAFELIMDGFDWTASERSRDADFTITFKLTNRGDAAVRGPIVTIRLPDKVRGARPTRYECLGLDIFVESALQLGDTYEATRDFFESNGRVGISHPSPIQALLPGHSLGFQGLGLRERDYPLGSELSFEFRVDAEDMVPFVGKVMGRVPIAIHDFDNIP